MKKEEIFKIFLNMFPQFQYACESYKKIGSKSIAISMKNGHVLFFMYYDIDNWELGTKIWRKCPTPPKKVAESK